MGYQPMRDGRWSIQVASDGLSIYQKMDASDGLSIDQRMLKEIQCHLMDYQSIKR